MPASAHGGNQTVGAPGLANGADEAPSLSNVGARIVEPIEDRGAEGAEGLDVGRGCPRLTGEGSQPLPGKNVDSECLIVVRRRPNAKH